MTSLIKGYISLRPSQSLIVENAGWLDAEEEQQKLTDEADYFDVSIPLSMILGFAEDYRKIVVNAKHELILMRSRNDLNAVLQESIAERNTYEEIKIDLT